MPEQFVWTEAAVSRLRVWWAEGVTAREIALRLGYPCTRNAVIGKANRLGLSKPRGRLRPPAARASSKPLVLAVHIPLTDLTAKTCRFPVSGEGIHTLFCGAGSPVDQPYCEEHHTFTHERGGRWDPETKEKRLAAIRRGQRRAQERREAAELMEG